MLATGVAVGAVVLPDGSTGQEPTGAQVHQLGESGCAAGGHSWTIRGCITQEEAREEREERARYSRQAEVARAQLEERRRLEKQGWSSFDEGIGAEGLFYRPLTTPQYESLSLVDTRCTDNPCYAMLIRSDSATDCSRGLTVRINLLSQGVVIGADGARIRSLPPESRARLVVGLSNDVEWGSHVEFTRLRCDSL